MIPPIARRFVAGESTAEALEHVRRLDDRDVRGMVNLLGSHNDAESAAAAVETYRSLAEAITTTDLDADVTLKPTQIGLDVGEDAFLRSLERVVDAACEGDVTVWLDMEEPETIDATLGAFESLGHRHEGKLGVCVQANMKRTRGDVDRLSGIPGKVRFVKGGAYDVPPSLAYQADDRIDRAYRNLLEDAFERFDDGVAVASHDPEMVEHAVSLHERHGTGVEFQMLMGVNTETQNRLASEYDVTQYVPYGPQWQRWALNRAKNDLPFVARTLVRQYVGA
jgi:proline dehydrogenase